MCRHFVDPTVAQSVEDWLTQCVGLVCAHAVFSSFASAGRRRAELYGLHRLRALHCIGVTTRAICIQRSSAEKARQTGQLVFEGKCGFCSKQPMWCLFILAAHVDARLTKLFLVAVSLYALSRIRRLCRCLLDSVATGSGVALRLPSVVHQSCGQTGCCWTAKGKG